ncbi:MAG: APC family permease [Calditrichaeota bacterium]|nr:APC family permease [Candidatus Cloacimonadota bacterium]MCB1047439.1 APC family permease [Calditrichota bacterium]
MLKQLPATAICGNDISSSCLYVSALSIIYAGKYAWVALLMVAAVLFLFRKIYGEVVGALPLNGGAYNALLNTTSKSIASVAAALTLLSYMATAVISASEAMHYVHTLWHGLPVVPATMVLLALFMVLTIIGIGESSRVAVGIFITHLVALVVLVGAVAVYISQHGLSVLEYNYSQPVEGGLLMALFFGFSAAMLGISGFESSANFVEEQAPGVFPKTLRNMWIVVSVFNPLIAFAALAIVPIPEVAANQEALLAHMGGISGGPWLAWFISIDAALVLSGAVLTSFVGVGGLVQRMALDRILPQFLLKLNKRKSAYRIMIVFFLLCVSILLITQGQLGALAGVYTISFLSVMILFGLGNVLLKVKRSRLPRPERAGWLALFVAVGAVFAALIGNATLNPVYLGVFFEYFIPTIGIVAVMLWRTLILRVLLHMLKSVSDRIQALVSLGNRTLVNLLDEINNQEFVFFTKHDDVEILNQVMIYVTRNEQTRNLRIVTVLPKGESIDPAIERDVEVLDRAYPGIKINFIKLEGHFGPELIERLSTEWKIPQNFMFIGSPGDHFPYKLADLGGVRLII